LPVRTAALDSLEARESKRLDLGRRGAQREDVIERQRAALRKLFAAGTSASSTRQERSRLAARLSCVTERSRIIPSAT